MSTRLSVFKAMLVQDSALSVSGLMSAGASDRPFSIVDGVPVLRGSGLKGAVVAMARRCFEPLPRSISEGPEQRREFRRSAWKFANARPNLDQNLEAILRAGVGIRQKTGARATGVLYDTEVIPSGTRWDLLFTVNWDLAGDEGSLAEGVLGYVLAKHWLAGRCWLGGHVTRGLGWCHLEDLEAYRLDEKQHETWIKQSSFPPPLAEIPTAAPSRSWCFRTRNVKLAFGEHRPDLSEEGWGLDMLSIGTHEAAGAIQVTSGGSWPRPAWIGEGDEPPTQLDTDRPVLTELGRPLIPGSSIRGPMRHMLSRKLRAEGAQVTDPHQVQGKVGESDPMGRVFGTVSASSRLLIRDASVSGEWAAARLHMHAEDEFSAGSYGSAKRDAVRLLKGDFSTQLVVEGPDEASIRDILRYVDYSIVLGSLGHLPVGGNKTRGAGWGRWEADEWAKHDVVPGSPSVQHPLQRPAEKNSSSTSQPMNKSPRDQDTQDLTASSQPVEDGWLIVTSGTVSQRNTTRGKSSRGELTLGDALSAWTHEGGKDPVTKIIAWWCEPSIDFSLADPPATFGHGQPEANAALRVDEVMFFLRSGVFHVARSAKGIRWVQTVETHQEGDGAERAEVRRVPVRMHSDHTRFRSADIGSGKWLVREWYQNSTVVGFTLEEVHKV